MKVGVSGFYPELLGQVDFFEIDAHDQDALALVRRKKIPNILSANHYFFTHSDPEVFRDRIEWLAHEAERARSLFCLLKLPPSFFNRFQIEDQISRFQREWVRHTQIEFAIDLPQVVPTKLLKDLGKLKALNYSLDPLWHKSSKTKHWKIHGWHDARWVRMYSDKDLADLKVKSKKQKPNFLIFAHSQRVIQVQVFLMSLQG